MHPSMIDRALPTAHWAAALQPPDDPTWQFEAPGYLPTVEHDIESRFTISNGFLGVRGSFEQPTAASRPRTFVAGLFDIRPVDPPIPTLVPGPDWLRFSLAIDGTPLSLERGETLAHSRVLDLRRGLLVRDWRWRDPLGRVVRLRTLRFVSLAQRALGVLIAQIEVDQPVAISLEAWLEPLSASLVPVQTGPNLSLWRTAQTARWLAIAHRATVQVDGTLLDQERNGDRLRLRWRWEARPDRPATFTRLIAAARGDQEADSRSGALVAFHTAQQRGAPDLLAAHTQAWSERWAASDVVVEGDDIAQCALRFALYHLIGAANPEDERVSIGARALTGEAYLGHVFWDTEIFLLPFYTLTWPAAARALLMYRFHTLPAARAKAARLGYRGALYAWESADTGEEATPPYVAMPDGRIIPIRSGTDEQHISADIAYAVWHYWQATGDAAFLRTAGAEILLETARFWASRAALEADGRYHIRNVIGPDEYHEGVDDNAYTNGLAQWTIERGLEVAQMLRARWPKRWALLREQLQLSEAELDAWRDVAARMALLIDPHTGIIEQFQGYFKLEYIDLAAYTPRTVPMDVLLGPERIRGSQVIKQADVVMLLALLWERFPPAQRRANFRYYEPRCGHGSSLSPAIHALVAARLGEVDLAERYFHQAAAIDLINTMGNTAGGVHIAALGGLWQTTVFGFAGLQPRPDGLAFEPHLPPGWRTLRFPLQWRRRRLQVDLRQAPLTLTVSLEHGRPLSLYVGARHVRLGAGQSWSVRLDASERQAEEGDHERD